MCLSYLCLFLCFFFLACCLFQIGSIYSPKLAQHSPSSYLCVQSCGVAGTCHHMLCNRYLFLVESIQICAHVVMVKSRDTVLHLMSFSCPSCFLSRCVSRPHSSLLSLLLYTQYCRYGCRKSGKQNKASTACSICFVLHCYSTSFP